jgi:hypothetical protein
MPREPDGYREQLEHLAERYPGLEVLTLPEVCKMLRCHRQTLLADRDFPARRLGGKGKYYIPVVGLARWLTTRN